MQRRYPDAEIGAENLLRNRLEVGAKLGVGETLHTPPATEHYPDIFYWDSVFAAIVTARAGLDGAQSERWVRSAQSELKTIIEGIEPNGFLPNLRYTQESRRIDPERILALGKTATSTNYTQPPVLALGVREAYLTAREHDERDARNFLADVYPKVRDHYQYFDRDMSNGSGPARNEIGIYHPHITGRDSDPTFDNLKPHRLPRRGPNTAIIVDKLNIAIDYADILLHGIRLRRAGGDVRKMREMYWVNDIMMNGIYVDNLHESSKLAWETMHISDAWEFQERAELVERQMLDTMWFPEERGGKGVFYALDKSGEPIKEISISNLFPLVLPNLHEEQLESLLDLLDESFNTPFPLPSVATDSRNYDPYNHESERLWRGPTWINTNWYIVERGLLRQIGRDDLAHRGDLVDRCVQWADRITKSSRGLVDQSGLREFYNPINGKGQRRRVKNFAWSNLAYVPTELDR